MPPSTRSKKRINENNIDNIDNVSKKVKFDDVDPDVDPDDPDDPDDPNVEDVDDDDYDPYDSNSEDTDESLELDESNDQHEKMLKKIKDIDEEAYTNMKNVLDIINDKNPEIMSILKMPMRPKDRAIIVELYEIFKHSHPLTEEWLELRFKINFLVKKYTENYKEYSKFTQKQIDDIKEKSRKIKDELTSEFSLKYQILSLDTSEQNKSAIYKKFRQYKKTGPNDDERGKLKTWIDCALNIPHNKTLTMIDYNNRPAIHKFLKNVTTSLNDELFGMKYVKEQLLLFLNSKLTNPHMKGCSLALVGPPGVGKTTIARKLAEVMQWPFEQISFGGANSSDFLKGHDYTYIGSKPGEVVRCLSRMKFKNGILFLDEYEKVSENKDMASCLLHITDFQQNHEFRDNYLSDIKIDLSQLWFIYSMNSLPEDAALRDRLFVINVPAYTQTEKCNIFKNFVMPKMLKNIGLNKKDIVISDETAQHIVNASSPDEAGIRRIEQIAKDLINKINFIVNNQDTEGNLPDLFNFMSFINSDSKLEKLTYPVTITRELFDMLFNSIKTKSTLPFGMYL